MAVKRGQTLDMEIESVAFGGRGLTRIDGMAVFVDGAVPGDRVQARITRKKKQYAEARTLSLLRPSPDRVAAPCPYNGHCGGCKWQFLRYDRQVAYKRQHVVEALAHIAGLTDVPVHPTVEADPIFGYRNKMEFSCADRRWLLPSELGREDLRTDFALGLHVPGTFHKVLDISACLLQPETGNTILGIVREAMIASGAPAYGLRSHEGFWRFLVLRHGVAEDRWMVNLVTSAEDRAVVDPIARQLMASGPTVASVVNHITSRKAGVAIGEREVHLAGDRSLRERIGPYTFEISAASFFQTNTRGAANLYEVTRRLARLTGGETVVDLYCGTGTIGIFLSDRASRVLGLEVVDRAVADAEKNARNNGVVNCRFLAGDVRTTLSAVEEPPDVMVIDPPRDGMHKDVVAGVMALAPRRIVYVSCNPATQARDIAVLAEAYRVAEVQPVDLFPHTWHIESVARLERLAGAANGMDRPSPEGT